MRFGMFDHVDRGDTPYAKQLDQRLEYVAAADAAGFYAYHIAEHHATPLNLVPVPGVYLGAVARATKRIRFGPLVYLLPLYSPLRLLEEIGMLDHLSNGRLELGVGRGVSAFELNYHKVDPETSRDVFMEGLEILKKGFANDRLTHHGKYWSYDNVPMELRPLQKPHPPIWYGSSQAFGSEWAGENGYHYCTLGSLELARGTIAAFRKGYAKRGNKPHIENDWPGGVAIGTNRYCVVADTDADARRIAEPAFNRWFANLTKLERENVSGPKFTHAFQANFEGAVAGGQFLCGSPDTVRKELERQVDAIGHNYIVTGFYMGNIAHEDAMRSMRLYATEVMPKLAARYP
jgi:alkanesulfonate monooxygenase SsuD/methylene tetrahydromethanopterin reductase-like flavin-dependent oxidoreductase (luciferase family)